MTHGFVDEVSPNADYKPYLEIPLFKLLSVPKICLILLVGGLFTYYYYQGRAGGLTGRDWGTQEEGVGFDNRLCSGWPRKIPKALKPMEIQKIQKIQKIPREPPMAPWAAGGFTREFLDFLDFLGFHWF